MEKENGERKESREEIIVKLENGRIDWLCRHMGIKNEDTYAIGDSVNDLDMLSFVGHGIAMGNGTPPAKEAAEFVTTDIYDDGIKHAMEHYGLI